MSRSIIHSPKQQMERIWVLEGKLTKLEMRIRNHMDAMLLAP